MPYVFFFSGLMVTAGLSLPRTSAYPVVYFLAFWCLLFALSAAYIFGHGIEYVSWPRLNPPIEVIHYDGPGYKSGARGRGAGFDSLPLPKWAKQNLVGSMRKVPMLHKLDEVEMGTTKMRVD